MEINIKQVSKRYKDVVALDKIDLTISQGMFGILGPNGAGKTTLMRILMALVPADTGEITVNGISINEKSKIREIVSYLPQDFSFYPSMSVFEAMDYMALLAGITNSKERYAKINELLVKVNLVQLKKRKFKTLSGGMKKRLGIAIALLKDPLVLIVDEPTAGLDPDERVRIRTLLYEFAKERIVILSTHIVEDIQHTCKNIAVFNEGKVIFFGERQHFLDEAIGKVRMISISSEEFSLIQSKYYVVSINEEVSGYSVKVISDELIGEEVKPNMEEAYLVKMYAETGNKIQRFRGGHDTLN